MCTTDIRRRITLRFPPKVISGLSFDLQVIINKIFKLLKKLFTEKRKLICNFKSTRIRGIKSCLFYPKIVLFCHKFSLFRIFDGNTVQ